MDKLSTEEQLQHLSEIRSLMERSSRFISLSGLSGVGAGVAALIGAALAQWRIGVFKTDYTATNQSLLVELVLIATGVLALALSVGAFFTLKEAKKQGQSIWDKSSQQLIINLLIPLVTGGLFCTILMYHKMYLLVAPATLIFYGLALVNASKYTLNDIRYLGILEILLGLINSFWITVGNSLVFWAVGFGVLHIVYGIFMHLKYNKD